MADEVEKCFVSMAMRDYGGSFVKCLGKLLLLADEDNVAKIKATWPEYWKKYEEFARTEIIPREKLCEKQE